MLPKEVFSQGSASLLAEKRLLEERLDAKADGQTESFERAESLLMEFITAEESFRSGNGDDRNTMLERCFSDILATPEKICPRFIPLAEKIANRERSVLGWRSLLEYAFKVF